MSKTVRLSSKLPGDPEINGLDAFADYLHDPDTPICVIAWVVPSKITEDLATGERVPTVEIRRIEPIGTPSHVSQAVQDLAAELYEKRTGRNPLPFADLVAPAGDVDELQDEPPTAGEVAEQVLATYPDEDADVFSYGYDEVDPDE